MLSLRTCVLFLSAVVVIGSFHHHVADASAVSNDLFRRKTDMTAYYELLQQKLQEVNSNSSNVKEVKVKERASSSLGPFASTWGFSGNTYPIVMVHGFIGWGSKPLLGVLNYWGGLATNLLDTLRDKGYTIYQPAIGPVSSNWERACELYASLKGTRVDYGVARAKKFGHERFGKDYSGQGLYPDWGTSSTKKAHFIAHSMGPATMRMLIALLENGSSEEVAASIAAGTTASPLFYTNKTAANFVGGNIAVAGVLQGTTFTNVLDGLSDFVNAFLDVIVGLSNVIPGIYDMQLSHWGLDIQDGEKFVDYIKRIYNSSWASSKSNAGYDLSIEGARDSLNSWVTNSKNVYYISIPCRTTYTLFGYDFPEIDTNIFLSAYATLMGVYSNSNLFGSNSKAWRPNDGQTNVISATSDDSSNVVSWSFNLKSSSPTLPSAPTKGVFHNTGTINYMSHIEINGVLDLLAASHLNQIYENLAKILYSLPA